MAVPIGEAVDRVMLRAKRLALLGEFIATLPTKEDQKRVVMALRETRIISSDSTEILISEFGLEAA